MEGLNCQQDSKEAYIFNDHQWAKWVIQYITSNTNFSQFYGVFSWPNNLSVNTIKIFIDIEKKLSLQPYYSVLYILWCWIQICKSGWVLNILETKSWEISAPDASVQTTVFNI